IPNVLCRRGNAERCPNQAPSSIGLWRVTESPTSPTPPPSEARSSAGGGAVDRSRPGQGTEVTELVGIADGPHGLDQVLGDVERDDHDGVPRSVQEDGSRL